MKWLGEFTEWLGDEGRSEKTVRAYRGDVKGFAEWYALVHQGERFEPGFVTISGMRRYQRYLKDVLERKPATINRKMMALRVLAQWAVDVDRVEAAILRDLDEVEVETLDQGAPRWLEEDAFAVLLDRYELCMRGAKTEKGRGRAAQQLMIFKLMAGVGLRSGEVVAVERGDIVRQNGTMILKVREGKGGKYAEVPLARPVVKALRGYLKMRELQGVETPYLFTSQKGGRLSDQQVRVYFKRMARMAGLDEGVTPHSLRHTFIKRLVRHPAVGIEKARRLARHAGVAQTLRYAEPSQGELAAAVEMAVFV